MARMYSRDDLLMVLRSVESLLLRNVSRPLGDGEPFTFTSAEYPCQLFNAQRGLRVGKLRGMCGK